MVYLFRYKYFFERYYFLKVGLYIDCCIYCVIERGFLYFGSSLNYYDLSRN